MRPCNAHLPDLSRHNAFSTRRYGPTRKLLQHFDSRHLRIGDLPAPPRSPIMPGAEIDTRSTVGEERSIHGRFYAGHLGWPMLAFVLLAIALPWLDVDR